MIRYEGLKKLKKMDEDEIISEYSKEIKKFYKSHRRGSESEVNYIEYFLNTEKIDTIGLDLMYIKSAIF